MTQKWDRKNVVQQATQDGPKSHPHCKSYMICDFKYKSLHFLQTYQNITKVKIFKNCRKKRGSACISRLGKFLQLVLEFPRLELQGIALQADMARFGAQECPKDMHLRATATCSCKLRMPLLANMNKF